MQLIERSELNAYDVLCNDVIVFTKATLPTGESATAKRSALLAADAPKDDTVDDAVRADGAARRPVRPANDDGSAPEGFDIKGNADSMLYHVPGSRFYDQTVAEIWFATADDAEAAGFQLPPAARRRRRSEEEQS